MLTFPRWRTCLVASTYRDCGCDFILAQEAFRTSMICLIKKYKPNINLKLNTKCSFDFLCLQDFYYWVHLSRCISCWVWLLWVWLMPSLPLKGLTRPVTALSANLQRGPNSGLFSSSKWDAVIFCWPIFLPYFSGDSHIKHSQDVTHFKPVY